MPECSSKSDVSLHPLTFDEAITALAKVPSVRILRLRGAAVPQKPPRV